MEKEKILYVTANYSKGKVMISQREVPIEMINEQGYIVSAKVVWYKSIIEKKDINKVFCVDLNSDNIELNLYAHKWSKAKIRMELRSEFLSVMDKKQQLLTKQMNNFEESFENS